MWIGFSLTERTEFTERVGLMSSSVRNRTHPLDEIRPLRLGGEFFLSQSAQSSRSFLAHSFEPTERLQHTEFTEAFQLTLAVTLCVIG